MIRIVKELLFKDLDNDEAFRKVPLIAGTATADTKVESTEHGLRKTISFQGTVVRTLPGMEGNLQLRLTYDNNDRETIGTAWLPVRISFSRSDIIRISFAYTAAEAL